jgi:penicillin-binding protein 1A
VVLSGGSGEWRPGNYGGKFSGPQTLAYALQRSINTISIKLTMDMGVDRVIKYARMMGIESDLPKDLSIALGSADVSLIDLTRAYGTLASEGRLIQPIFIRRVYDRDGKLLEDRMPRVEGFGAPPENAEAFRKWLAGGNEPMWGPLGYAFRKSISQSRWKEVLDPKTVYVVISMMMNVVQAGTGTNARLPGIEVAGKTGTTNNYRDALFIGFTTQLLTGVWIGYDNPHISLGHGSTGGDLAAPIWARYMLKALSGHVIPEFNSPEGIIIYTFDCWTGTYPGPDSKDVCRAAFKGDTQPGPYVPPASQGQDFLQQDLKLQGQQQEEFPP